MIIIHTKLHSYIYKIHFPVIASEAFIDMKDRKYTGGDKPRPYNTDLEIVNIVRETRFTGHPDLLKGRGGSESQFSLIGTLF